MESLELQGDMEAYIEALDVLTGASSWLLPVCWLLPAPQEADSEMGTNLWVS